MRRTSGPTRRPRRSRPAVASSSGCAGCGTGRWAKPRCGASRLRSGFSRASPSGWWSRCWPPPSLPRSTTRTTWRKGTVVVLSGHDDSIDGQRGKLIEQWNALHPDTQALIVELPEIADAQRSEMLARAQAGGGGVDVYNLDVTWTAEFAAAGFLQSLDESRVRTGDFLPGPLSSCRYDDRLWALPFNTDVGLLYYNTELLTKVERTEPPSTWGGLIDDAEEIAGISQRRDRRVRRPVRSTTRG